MRHDLVLRQVKVELQRHQHGELEGDQLAPVHPKPLLQFLWGRNTPQLIHYTAAQEVRTLRRGVTKVARGRKGFTSMLCLGVGTFLDLIIEMSIT